MKQPNNYISIMGKNKKVNSIIIDKCHIISIGKLLKLARVQEEWLQYIDNYKLVINSMQEEGFKADILTFIQKIDESLPKYKCYFEWENRAVIPVTTYENWFENQVNRMIRKAIKKSVKRGVEVRLLAFDDHLVEGIKKIYDEVPVRQGKPFWHYGKDFDLVKRENGTFLDISQFIGAYLGDEIVGFMKMVFSENMAFTMQILSMIKHRDKSVTNALIAAAVQVCAERKIKYFVYGEMNYSMDGLTNLSVFKQRNGFIKLKFPRYYIPLNNLGKIVLKAKLHRGIRGVLPEKLIYYLKENRGKYYNYKYGDKLHKEENFNE